MSGVSPVSMVYYIEVASSVGPLLVASVNEYSCCQRKLLHCFELLLPITVSISQSCCGAVVVRREYLIATFSCHTVTVVSLSR